MISAQDDKDKYVKAVQRLAHVYEALGDELLTSGNVDDDVINGVADHVKFMIEKSDENHMLLRTMTFLPAKDTDTLVSTWIFRVLIHATFYGSASPYYIRFQLTLVVALVSVYSYLANQILVTDEEFVIDIALFVVPPIMIIFTLDEALEFSKHKALERGLMSNSSSRSWRRPFFFFRDDGLWDKLQIQHRGAIISPCVVWLLVKIGGFPQSYAEDPWNIVDLLSIIVLWTVGTLVFVVRPIVYVRDVYQDNDWVLRERDDDYNSFDDESPNIRRNGKWRPFTPLEAFLEHLVLAGVLLLWAKLLGFLRVTHERFAAFSYMLVRVVADLELFLFVLFGVFIAFTQIFYLRLRRWNVDGFDYDDHQENSNAYNTFRSSMQAIYLLGVIGEINEDNYPRHGDLIYLDLCIFIVAVVLMNIVIAIITTSYENAMASSEQRFWRHRLTSVATAQHDESQKSNCILRLASCFQNCFLSASKKRKHRDLEYLKRQLKIQLEFMGDADDTETSLSSRRLRRVATMVRRIAASSRYQRR